MEINIKRFIQVFERNFTYPIVETQLGYAVKMDSYNAFIYSSVTGSGYFDNTVYLYTPKGLFKIFYNAFDYKFVTGIFENTTLKNTPYIISQAKKFLFDGEKYIVPVEFERERDLRDFLTSKYQSIKSDGLNTTDFIIQRIEKSKKGCGMEPFMEYLTSEFFKKRGFIVENQIPLAHSIGSPDFGGYKLSKFFSALSKENIITEGYHLIELSLIRLFRRQYTNKINKTIDAAIVGEAKTSTSQMNTQLTKYMDTGLFIEGYEIHPNKLSPTNTEYGLVTLDNEGNLKLIEPKDKLETQGDSLKKEKYYSWLNNYVKYFLIANLDNDEFSEFYYKYNSNKISSVNDIINFINRTDCNILIKEIKNYI